MGKIEKIVDDYSPDIIGITAIMIVFGYDIKTAEVLKILSLMS